MNVSELLLGLVLYAFVTSITPGPNNLMVLASGVNFGVVRSVPHIMGISIGFAAMVLSVGAGLGTVFDHYPAGHALLRWLGAAYLVYLAWQIAKSEPLDTQDQVRAARPMGFWAAAAFQWVNPKAWIMAVGAITSFLPSPATALATVALAGIFAVVNAPCVALWAVCGSTLKRFLTRPSQVRAFNLAMASLLVVSLFPLILH